MLLVSGIVLFYDPSVPRAVYWPKDFHFISNHALGAESVCFLMVLRPF
jgi:hypothetical protein